jgi:hypothetical protein
MEQRKRNAKFPKRPVDAYFLYNGSCDENEDPADYIKTGVIRGVVIA